MNLDALRAFIKTTPLSPGVYVIRNAQGNIIYIGKARELRSRLSSHFVPQFHPDAKENLIRQHAVKIEIVETATEAEALLLEASMVKEHHPLYNIDLKDDKSYPYLKITAEEFPRLLIVRGSKNDGARYYGPYTDAKLLRQAVSLLRRMFPMRTCNPLPKKVCLMYHIGQCKGPCENKIDVEEYAELVKEIMMFLEGKKSALVRMLTRRMDEAAKNRDYETARACRDQIRAISSVSAKPMKIDRASVLLEMQERLKLSRYPTRIEAFDISNFQGKNPVGSMVVFIDGKPCSSEYRKFKIKTVEGIDDYSMMREVVRRRYERLLNEKKDLPDLILIDGGRGHLASAKDEIDRLNLSDLDIISIAKQNEYLFKPTRLLPYVFPQDSAVLKLLRHVRDEAHRFAITYYRGLHRKELVANELENVPGVGPVKRKKVLKAFGVMSNLRAADAQTIAAKAQIDIPTARKIEEYLKTG